MNIESYSIEIQQQYEQVCQNKLTRGKKAMVEAKAFLKSATELNDPILMGIANFYLADACYDFKRNRKEFANYLQHALLYLQNTDETEYLMQVYNLFGIDANNHGNVQLSVDYFTKALNVENSQDPSYFSAIIKFNIGQIFAQVEEYKPALKYVKEAHRVIHKKAPANRRDMEAYCYCFEANINLALGRMVAARRCMERLDKIIARITDIPDFAYDPYFLSFHIRMNHAEGDFEQRDAQIALFLERLQGDYVDLGSITEVFDFMKFLTEIKNFDALQAVVDYLTPIMEDADIPSIQETFAKLLINYYSLIDDVEHYNQALADYYRYSQLHNLNANKAYALALNTSVALDAMEKENARLVKAANTDGLTGIPNRSALNEYLNEIFEQCRDEEVSLGIEFLDIDFFKEYNDTYGHQAGDQVLIQISKILQEIATDERIYVGRYGGDEFVLVYRNMTDDEILAKAEEIRNRVLGLAIEHKHSTNHIVSVSQGIRNRVPTSNNKLWDFLYTADNALYQVKRTQKGQIVLMHTAIISSRSLADATQF
ncbi:MAG: GGDEF domain-containing protein [Lachnospiraceae bacterium]|nr:GGDEF domain-containing protein [Lachnospiraceae bacterium]